MQVRGGHYPPIQTQGFSYVANNERGKPLQGMGELHMSTRLAQPDAEHKQALLIVDDEPASMRALCDTLEYEGYQTYGYTSPAEALAAMRERSFDLLLADLQMPGTNGIDLMSPRSSSTPRWWPSS